MPNEIDQSVPDARRQQLDALIRQLDGDSSISHGLLQALKSVLTAMDYDDPALMRSHLNTALEEFRDTVNEEMQEKLEWATRVRNGFREMCEMLKGYACENVDDLGRQIDSGLDRVLQALVEFQDGPVKLLQERGYQVENADQLTRAIEGLQDLKARILRGWPWSDKVLPPLDRKMIAESKATFTRREGESIQDFIGRLGGTPVDNH